MRIAITRDISPNMNRCERTHVARVPIDIDRARDQHRAYEACLSELGCTVERLPAEPALPDSVFVEDAAVVLDECAVIARPGALSRRGEVESIAAALSAHRELACIREPGTLDGGDVLRVDRRVYVGRSSRTNVEGIEQLRAAVVGSGYEVIAVDVRGCLHLKSAVTRVGEDALLVNPEWVDAGSFDDLDRIEVHAEEPMAANALLVGGAVVYAAQYWRTAERLESLGIDVRRVDVTEIARAEGGVTCCSLILEDRQRVNRRARPG